MKGLIFKDFMCLRKGMKTFVLVTFGVVVLAVMFLLSGQYGNLANSLKEIQEEASLEANMTMSMLETSVWFMLLVPIAFMTDVVQCFREDAKAGFHKTLSGMALTYSQIVGSRYLTTLLFAGVSMGASLIAALIISMVSTNLTTQSLVAGVFTFGSLFLVYMSLNLFLIYLCDARKADLIQIIPLIVLFVVTGNLVMRYAELPEEEVNRMMVEFKDKAEIFLQRGYKWLLPISATTMLLSYIGSVSVMKHRRRVL